MANSSITFTWYDESANSTDSYVHEFTQENYDRVIEAGRLYYGTPNAVSMVVDVASRNKARKEMSKGAVRVWKERARDLEVAQATANVSANIPPIDSTEV